MVDGCERGWFKAALLDAADTSSWAVVVDGSFAGAVSAYDVGWPPGTSVGVAIIVLGDTWQDRGLGPDAVSVLFGHVIRERGVHRFSVDPAATNLRAVRAHERLGSDALGSCARASLYPAAGGATACLWICSRLSSSTVRVER